MTDRELSNLEEQVVLDEFRARQELNALAVMAERTADALTEIAGALKSDPSLILNEGFRRRVAPLLVEEIASSSPFRSTFFFESLLSFARRYDAARKSVETFGGQKAKLGIVS